MSANVAAGTQEMEKQTGGGLDRRFEELLHSFRARLEADLDDFLHAKEESFAEINGQTRELTGRLREYIARGGKRLRPALVYFGHRAGGGDGTSVLPVAMALELLHSYLLIHDDIMDRAETRRGRASAHREFQADHLRRGWHGNAERHGEAVAILLGDLAHSYALELFLALPMNESTRTKAYRCFAAMSQEVVVGQYLEMTAPQRSGLDEETLLEILRLKSGRYSIERPLQLGALLAGATAETLNGLASYGLAMGEAFQLQDDLLGVFGDRAAVGKPVGSDLAEGKFTVLILAALQRARESDRKRILACLHDPNPEAKEIDAVAEIVDQVGAREHVGRMVAQRLATARESSEGLALEAEGRVFLTGLVEYLRGRRS